MTDSLIIIGGGMSGVMAAWRALAAGRPVVQIFESRGRLSLLNGLIRLGDSRRRQARPEEASLSEALNGLFDRHPTHPLASFDQPAERLESLIDDWCRALPHLYDPPSAPLRSGWCPDEWGFLEACFHAPRSHLKLTLASAGTWGVVGLAAYPRLNPEVACDALNHAASRMRLPTRFKPFFVDWPGDGTLALHPLHLARRIDGESDFASLTDALRGLSTDGLSGLLLPPVLGFDAADRCDRLSREWGGPVRELAGTQDALFGLRLSEATRRLLASHAGYRSVVGRAEELRAEGPRLLGAWMRVLGEPERRFVEGETVLLAIGKYLGGGIRHDENGFHLSLRLPFPAPLRAAGEDDAPSLQPGRLSPNSFFSRSPLFMVGLKVDSEGRVLGEDDRPVCDSLYAAGQVTAGFDSAFDLCADAMDGLTADRAVRSALRESR